MAIHSSILALQKSMDRGTWQATVKKKVTTEQLTNSQDYKSKLIFIKNLKQYLVYNNWASLVAQMLKHPTAVQETWVPSLGWEDPQEKGMATHSSVLAWKIP